MIGKNIEQARKQAGLTMEELAKKIGVTKATIHKYESGNITNIKYDRIIDLANACGVNPEVIMGWENQKETADNIKVLMKDPSLKRLVSYYVKASDKDKEALISFMELLKNQKD